MEEIFLKLLNISIMAGWLVLAIMAARLLLRKAPKWICCVMWIIVGIRLIMPFSIESHFSLLDNIKTISFDNDINENDNLSNTDAKNNDNKSNTNTKNQNSIDISDLDKNTIINSNLDKNIIINSNLDKNIIINPNKNNVINSNKNNVINPNKDNVINSNKNSVINSNRNSVISPNINKNTIINPNIAANKISTVTTNIKGSQEQLQKNNSAVLTAAAKGWFVIMVLMLVYMLLSYIILFDKLRTSTKLYDNVWQSDKIDSSFVFGIISPKIYLPYNVKNEDIDYIIAHEKSHIKRCDHILKMFSFVLLSVYWFNPLIWAAYILFSMDIELACDEKVIKVMDKQIRRQYSQALLNCSTNHHIAAGQIAFGEISVKRRIKNIMNYKKPKIVMILMAAAVCIITAVCFLTIPEKSSQAAVDNNKVDISDISTIDNDKEKNINNPSTTNDNNKENISSITSIDNTDLSVLDEVIEKQSFKVFLNEWENVTFASFMPKDNTVSDVVFKLLKNNETVYTFDGMNEENTIFPGEKFLNVIGVGFTDINDDGKKDIITLCEYENTSGVKYNSPRIYIQKSGAKEYEQDSIFEEWISKQGLCDSIETIIDSKDKYYYYLSSLDGSHSTDAQLELIAKNKDIWLEKPEFADDVFCYAITNLNLDDRLEVIVSHEGGTGHYSYNSVYEVNKEFNGLIKWEDNFAEGDSQLDIIEDKADVYYNSTDEYEGGVFYYVFSDFIHAAPKEYYTRKGALVVKNRSLSEDTFAWKNELYDASGKSVVSYETSIGEKISEEEYINIADIALSTLEKWTVCFGWQDARELVGIDDVEQIKEKLKASNEKLTYMKAEKITDISFDDILKGNEQFIYVSEGTVEAKSIYDVPALFDANDAYMKICKFAVIDLDGDKNDEIILSVNGTSGDMGGNLILHKMDGKVYGYTANYKSMEDLKADGTYSYSDFELVERGEEYGICYITDFTKEGYNIYKTAYCYGVDANLFAIEYQYATEEEFLKVKNSQDLKQDAVWYDFNDENMSSGMEERYKAILLDNGDFVNIDISNKDRRLSLENIKEVVSDEDWVTAKVTKFTVIDLDGNGENEVVLWIQANEKLDYGFEILYFKEGEVYGFTLPYRGFLEPKTDGTFYISGGADNTRLVRLKLSDRGYIIEDVSDNEHQEGKTNVLWYDLTDGNVELAFKNMF